MNTIPLDWIAGALEVCGLWVVGNKNRKGFILNGLCCVLWTMYVFSRGHTFGILIVVIPALAINIRNWIKWTPVTEEGILDKRDKKGIIKQ